MSASVVARRIAERKSQPQTLRSGSWRMAMECRGSGLRSEVSIFAR
jgi:hypothetical protein